MCSIAAGPPEGALPENLEDRVLQGGAEQRIAEIERAIDDLANVTWPTGLGITEPMVARVAELWGLLAELDPEVARRLAGYQALSAVPQSELVALGLVG